MPSKFGFETEDDRLNRQRQEEEEERRQRAMWEEKEQQREDDRENQRESIFERLAGVVWDILNDYAYSIGINADEQWAEEYVWKVKAIKEAGGFITTPYVTVSLRCYEDDRSLWPSEYDDEYDYSDEDFYLAVGIYDAVLPRNATELAQILYKHTGISVAMNWGKPLGWHGLGDGKAKYIIEDLDDLDEELHLSEQASSAHSILYCVFCGRLPGTVANHKHEGCPHYQAAPHGSVVQCEVCGLKIGESPAPCIDADRSVSHLFKVISA